MRNASDQNNISYKNERNKQERVYVGGSGASDMGFDDRDVQVADELAKEKKKNVAIALSAVLLAVIVVVVYLAVTRLNTGKSKSIKLVDTYMSGLENTDVDKVKSVMDRKAVDDDSINTLVKIFETYNENGIQYTLEYTTAEGREASPKELDAVSQALYSKTADKAGVKKGYVVPVRGTIMLTYDGQTSPYEMDMDIICYEKDGEWYLGGTVDNGTDTTESAE